MLLSIKLTRVHFTKNMEEMCTICVWHGYITRRAHVEGGKSRGVGIRDLWGRLLPSGLNGRYVNPIKIWEVEDYAQNITTKVWIL